MLTKALLNFALAGRDRDVARQRQRAARAGGDAVDGRDHRLRQRADLPDHRIVMTLDHAADRARVVHRFMVGQILSGAEAAAGSGEDDGPYRLVAVEIGQRRAQLAEHGEGEGVEPVRPVEGQARDRAVALEQDGGFQSWSFPGEGFAIDRRRRHAATSMKVWRGGLHKISGSGRRQWRPGRRIRRLGRAWPGGTAAAGRDRVDSHRRVLSALARGGAARPRGLGGTACHAASSAWPAIGFGLGALLFGGSLYLYAWTEQGWLRDGHAGRRRLDDRRLARVLRGRVPRGRDDRDNGA